MASKDTSNSPIDGTTPDGGATNKRKNPDGSDLAVPQRAKRNRYISIACNECKRRKIKCNGQTPCQRCGHLQLECLYAPNCCNNFKDSDDFKRMDTHINSLQAQVDQLYENLNNLRNHVDANMMSSGGSSLTVGQYKGSMPPQQDPTLSRSQPRRPQKHPQFHGPTSVTFNLGVAKSSLQSMGITAGEEQPEDGMGTGDPTPMASPPLPPLAPAPSPHIGKPILHKSKDPMWAINKEEAIRLCHSWNEEMGTMYPVLEVEDLTKHATLLYTFMEAAHRTRLVEVGFPGADSISDDQTMLLKLVLSTALVLEGSGTSELGAAMYESIRHRVEGTLSAPANVKSIQMLATAGMYHFHRDAEALAGRFSTTAARLCLELGLHRSETYGTLSSDDKERNAMLKLFWSVYVLDRRWAFGTGLPFALNDADIDPHLPKPEDSTPYLDCMIAYSHIGSRVWKSVANHETTAISKEEIGFLDYQVLQWHRAIPPSLKYAHPSSGNVPDPKQVPRSQHRFRILLYLRANQMRMLIHRPILHTPASIAEDMPAAQTVVDVAKDTIVVLTHTNQTTDLYRRHQVMFNYFLISALAILFLAVCHAPAQFSEHCRDEFYMAIDLVRGLSANSFVSKRLWRTVKILKEVGPKLGLNVRPAAQQQQQQASAGRPTAVDTSDAHSSAAVAMAGLAGHPVDESFFLGNQNRSSTTNGQQQQHQQGVGQGGATSSTASVPRGGGPNGTNSTTGESPNVMANDLTSLFEAAGGFAASTGFAPQNGYLISASGGEGGPQAIAGIAGGAFGQDEELARILRDLF
ncbi:fungal-specific transcription factor domain-containing protein [Phyllosticta capitalensis]